MKAPRWHKGAPTDAEIVAHARRMPFCRRSHSYCSRHGSGAHNCDCTYVGLWASRWKPGDVPEFVTLAQEPDSRFRPEGIVFRDSAEWRAYDRNGEPMDWPVVPGAEEQTP